MRLLAVLTLSASLAAAVSVAAQQSSAAAQARPLRIGIIGAGNMGGPLGVTWAKAGHQVLWASRMSIASISESTLG